MEVFWVYFWLLKATYKQDSFDYDLYIPIGAVLSSCGGFLRILFWVAREKFLPDIEIFGAGWGSGVKLIIPMC